MKRTAKPRLGRPPLPENIRKGRPIPVRARPDQAAQIDALAEAWGLDRTATILRAVEEAHARTAKASSRKARR